MFIGRILCDNYVDLLHCGRGYCSGTAVELCLACTWFAPHFVCGLFWRSLQVDIRQ